jgi:hypothetical protein
VPILIWDGKRRRRWWWLVGHTCRHTSIVFSCSPMPRATMSSSCASIAYTCAACIGGVCSYLLVCRGNGARNKKERGAICKFHVMYVVDSTCNVKIRTKQKDTNLHWNTSKILWTSLKVESRDQLRGIDVRWTTSKIDGPRNQFLELMDQTETQHKLMDLTKKYKHQC